MTWQAEPETDLPAQKSGLPAKRALMCEGGCTMPIIDFDTYDDEISVCGQPKHGATRCIMTYSAEELAARGAELEDGSE